MKLLLLSSRIHFDLDLLTTTLAKVKTPITLLITVGRAGQAGTTECYAIDHGIPVQVHYPPPEGMADERTSRMVEAADSVLAFWDFNHEGIRQAVTLATEAGKKTAIIKI